MKKYIRILFIICLSLFIIAPLFLVVHMLWIYEDDMSYPDAWRFFYKDIFP